MKEVEIILQFMDSNSSEILESCLDSLRFCINKDTKPLLLTSSVILKQISSFANSDFKIRQKLSKDFLQKLSIF